MSQPGPSMPIAASATLIAPRVGCISAVKVKPTPMDETSTGKKITVRRKPCAKMPEVSSTASRRPSTVFDARGDDRVDQRVDQALEQERLARRTARKLSRPMKVAVNRSQRVRLNQKEATVGTRNSTAKMTAPGRMNQ